MTVVSRTMIGDSIQVGDGAPLVLFGGPCAIEGREATIDAAGAILEICAELGVPYVFKASFDKANRSSVESFRGPGIDAGLQVLSEVKSQLGVPLVTDIHEPWQAAPVAAVVDVLQIPAFLCRQTDLLLAAAATPATVNVKKGQFVSAREMRNVLEKLRSGGARGVLLTERGTFLGYNDLVVDFRGLCDMRDLEVPVVFDATHSVQRPGGLGDRSGGQRQYVPLLARAAVAVGVDALFMEIHRDPDRALSDGPNMVPIARLREVLENLLVMDRARRSFSPAVLEAQES